MPKYYLQTEADPEVFEIADEYVFRHRAEAIVTAGYKPTATATVRKRYTGFGLIVDENDIEFVGVSKISLRELAVITRFLGIKPDGVGTKGGGFLREVETVNLSSRGREILHVMFGDNWTRQPAKKEKAAA